MGDRKRRKDEGGFAEKKCVYGVEGVKRREEKEGTL